MSEKAQPEFSFDQVAEPETDDDFGIPEIKEHFAETATPAVLREWTAKDFASIYIRFRPHLERHARRFLHDPLLAEEAVQDAFLYLMTSLPELDSELGVLKFLKWKVRLLALDVIRANPRAKEVSLEFTPEVQDREPAPIEIVERAEDASIVALALAKLEPRHRKALIATVYDEKTYTEAASDLGISENAFRQLLFRARRAFKVALIGTAEVQGKSVTEILSIAAKHAARSARAVPAILILTLMTIGSLAQLPSGLQTAATETPSQVPLGLERNFGSLENLSSTQVQAADAEIAESPPAIMGASESDGDFESRGLASLTALTEPSKDSQPSADQSSFQEALGVDGSISSALEEAAFQWTTALLTDLTIGSEPKNSQRSANAFIIDIGSSSKLHLILDQVGNKHIASAILTASGAFEGLVAIPTMLYEHSALTPSGETRISAMLTGFAVGDVSGALGSAVLEEAHLREVAIQVDLTYSDESRTSLTSFSAEFSPRA